MSDVNHSDKISKLSDIELELLYSNLMRMKDNADSMENGIKVDKNLSIDDQLGGTIQVSGGEIHWIPSPHPVNKALDAIHREMVERELLREE